MLLPSGEFSVTSSHLKSNNSKTCFLKLSDLTFVSDSLNSMESGRGGEKGGEGLRWQAVDLAEELLSWNKCRKLSRASKETVRMGWRKRFGLVYDRDCTWRSLFQTSVESKGRSHTGWSCDEFNSTYGVLTPCNFVTWLWRTRFLATLFRNSFYEVITLNYKVILRSIFIMLFTFIPYIV